MLMTQDQFAVLVSSGGFNPGEEVPSSIEITYDEKTRVNLDKWLSKHPALALDIMVAATEQLEKSPKRPYGKVNRRHWGQGRVFRWWAEYHSKDHSATLYVSHYVETKFDWFFDLYWRFRYATA